MSLLSEKADGSRILQEFLGELPSNNGAIQNEVFFATQVWLFHTACQTSLLQGFVTSRTGTGTSSTADPIGKVGGGILGRLRFW